MVAEATARNVHRAILADMATRRAASGAVPVSSVLPPATSASAPLAARMRPRNLDEFAGQLALVGPHGALRRMIERGHLTSMVLWGPPGSGKTTLARLLADAIDAPFSTLSAVMSGVAEVRGRIAGARGRLDQGGGGAGPFFDENHPFKKTQQDALLPPGGGGAVTP